MIILTRFGGHEMAVNPDLIERAESTPDTVITMVDGHKLVVVESVEEVVGRIRRWRASVAAEAFVISHEDEPDVVPTAATPGNAPLAQVLRMPSREV